MKATIILRNKTLFGIYDGNVLKCNQRTTILRSIIGRYQASLYANIKPVLINTLKEIKIIIATTIQQELPFVSMQCMHCRENLVATINDVFFSSFFFPLSLLFSQKRLSQGYTILNRALPHKSNAINDKTKNGNPLPPSLLSRGDNLSYHLGVWWIFLSSAVNSTQARRHCLQER